MSSGHTQSQYLTGPASAEEISRKISEELFAAVKSATFADLPTGTTNPGDTRIVGIPRFHPSPQSDKDIQESQDLPETGTSREMFRLSSQHLTKPGK